MFKLSRYFAFTSLIAFIAVVILLGFLYRQAAVSDLMALRESQNVALTQAFSNSIWPELQPFITSLAILSGDELRTHPIMPRLREAVITQMQGTSVVKVKIYNLAGITVFSTESTEIGADQSSNAGVRAATAGQVVSILTHRDTFNAFDGVIEDSDVFASYIPLWDGGPSGAIVGVFEIYTDVTPFLQHIEQSQVRVVGGMALLMAVLYGVLLLIVRHAERAIRRHEAERQRAERALYHAKVAAEAANHAKSAFLANMSHELRTPLTAILGYSELLQLEARQHGSIEFADDLERIHTAGQHLLALINNILDLSKIEAGKMQLHLETFAITPLVDEVVTTLQPLIARQNDVLHIHCPADIGTMYADMTMVRQILFNLLSNAVKFTEQGRITLTVSRESAGEDTIRFSITDTGIGIAPEHIAYLFQDFTQADSSMTRKYGGTGLGLAISRRFCELMGGRITVASTPGAGSTFTVYLPARVTEHSRAPEPDSTQGARERALPSETDISAPEQPDPVLVIDDDPVVQELLARYLAHEGFRVTVAGSGEEGLRLARELRPAAITLDALMPGTDGWAVLSALKHDPALADIPVAMISIADDLRRAFALGAAAYLTKPIDLKRLVATLQTCQQAHDDSAADRVLLVEDDRATRALLRRTLEAANWTVFEAGDGCSALVAVREHSPALIVLDLMLPGMDGFEFITELRAVAVWQAIPVIVVTALELTPSDRQRLNGYVEHILQKNAADIDTFLRSVCSQVRRHVRARERSTTQAF